MTLLPFWPAYGIPETLTLETSLRLTSAKNKKKGLD